MEGPAYIFCDTCGVAKNMNIPESVPHKKRNAINHHSVCESVSADILIIGNEDGETNLVDSLAKVMTGQKRWDLCYHILC